MISAIDINTISDAELLAIVERRLTALAAGENACREDGIALRHVRIAMDAISDRTNESAASSRL
jgi:hypothetical protein